MSRVYLYLILLFIPSLLKAQVDTVHYGDTLRRVEITRPTFYKEEASTMPVQHLSKKDLDNLNSISVSDAIKFFSGVQVLDYGGIGGMKTIDVRSLSSNHTSIFYNGIAINNAQNGQVDLGKFSLDNIESITLFNGQQTKLLIPAKAFSSASTLLLESQKPVFEEGKTSHLKVGARVGDFGLFNPSLLWQQKLSKNTSVSFNTEWVKANGRYDFYYAKGDTDTLINRQNSDVDALRLEAALMGTLKDSSIWEIRLYNYTSERGLPGAAVDNKYYSNDRQWDKDFFVQGRWEKKYNDIYSLLINAKYDRLNLRYKDPDFHNTQGFLENNYKQKEAYVSAANLFVLSNTLKSSVSVDYFYNKLDADLKDFAYPERHTLLINAAIEWKKNNFQIQANGLTAILKENVRVGNSAGTKQILSPSISASWKPFADQNLYVRSFFKSIFRAPTFNDSYYTIIGSTSLNPEYVNQYDLGFTWQKAFNSRFQQVTFKADAYHNRIKDRITAIPLANLFRWSMVNLGRVEINGLDLGVSGNVAMDANINLDLGVNYTYQKALDKTPNGANFNQFIPYAPRNSGSGFIAASYKAFGLNYNVLYTGERYSLRTNIAGNQMEDWFIQNLSVSYQNKLAKLNYKLLAEANNITNINYTVIRNYPMPGRNYRISFQISY
ncbi:TonB-dependent receptor plug domain-containing protein [Albibacterium bauzanense]|uniref:Outer membrane cobalamin receptor n=1 Tax=Albibacterium bauzanense TaxID=653929 RepID=A0A4R1LNR7_9SPHI|nr:TonB-dependent receptor plug domain-containing protein [Albibacterium bauzanense]TCK80696.1 outer membrane cobalamin receptor [Albibacterium bauzanense]